MRKAVALAYGKNPIPVVTAKGDADLAWRMLEEAQKQGVFISEDPQLLALLSRLDTATHPSISMKRLSII